MAPVAAGEAFAADKVAVLPLEIGGGVPAGRAALEAAVGKGLLVGGRPVAIGPEVSAALGKAGARVTCADGACWKAAGRALEASHLLAGSIDRKGEHFEVEFRLVDARGGRVVLSEVNRCEVADCSVAELCRMTVHELARAGLPVAPAPVVAAGSEPGASPSSSAPSEVVAPPLPLPTPATYAPDLTRPSLSETARAPEESTSGFSSWFPATAIAGGVVLGLGGAFLISKDGECTNTRCRDFYRTFWGGIAAAGAGAALAASGIVVGLVGGDDGDEARARPAAGLAIGPGGVTVAGRF